MQHKTPILEALLEYRRQGTVRLHMPGHKGGPGADPILRHGLGGKALALDVTGVEGMDDLHQPGGIIREAQELASMAFGADHSFFLVNGTSAGVHAMILAACNPGDKLLVPRNVHKSILGGIILSGARPVFMQPVIHRELGIAMGLTPGEVESCLARHPDSRGVLVVNPTYYGSTSDLRAIAEVVHRRGLPLLVDEAHGPHFRFHPRLPTPALEAGADACAQGVHKILGGLTQSSIRHVKGTRIDVSRVKAALRTIQSTSASYLLLASLDAARRQMATRGRELLDRALELAEKARSGVNAIEGLYCFGEEMTGLPGIHELDLTKVTITVRGLGLTGYRVEGILRYAYNIQVELSDLYNVLCIIGPGNTADEVERLLGALAEISRSNPHREALSLPETEVLPPIPEQCLPPREAFFSPSTSVKLKKSAGRVCAEVVTCYPPGIPLLCPGELITREVIEHLGLVRRAGARLQGLEDPSLRTIRVLS